MHPAVIKEKGQFYDIDYCTPVDSAYFQPSYIFLWLNFSLKSLSSRQINFKKQ